MSDYSKEDILQMVESEDVEFIRLQMTDMFGNLKNIAITVRELPRALNNEYTVDGSFLAGSANRKEVNYYLHPDLDTFAILPWRPQQRKVARMICDIYFVDGVPCVYSSRYLLKKIASRYRDEGYVCLVDPECEFFLFHTDEDGIPTTLTHERATYLDMDPLDFGENARRDMVFALEDLDITVESSHHEYARAQHEIHFTYGEIRSTADRIMSFKMTVRTVAKRHGLHATFMPKPVEGDLGSGMHLYFSLYKGGKNIFTDSKNPGKMSEDALCFIGGILAHSKEMALITNPIVNSYKRLVHGFEAPVELTWTSDNQNSLVRVPQRRDGDVRIELRSPDPSGNPYLVLGVCLAAGMDGIQNRIFPTEASANLEEAEQKVDRLPENLGEAIEYFEKSQWIKDLLGESFCRKYVIAKKEEWRSYLSKVSPWEIENYLYRI